MTTQPDKIVGDAFAVLEEAWNAADGTRFVEPFHADAHFVDIRGDHHTGAEAIGTGHQMILDTIYKGSTVRYEVETTEVLTDGCVVGIVNGTMEAPAGPLQGVNHSTISAVLTDEGGTWKIRSFQNTLKQG